MTAEELGTVFFVWALFQSLVPALVGGLSDRLGYKLTIFISTVVKIIAYLIMAFYPSFWGFTIGAIVLATGTGIFKPGIQGTLVKATNRQNSSMAWGIFYQTVNIGGWMGPLLAAQMRQLAWSHVFFACAAIISINFLLLLTYREVGKEERLERNRRIKAGEEKQESLWRESLKEIAKTHVWLYLLIFSGFWFMFNALFDVLPAHIDDWVDTRPIVADLFGQEGTSSEFIKFFVVIIVVIVIIVIDVSGRPSIIVVIATVIIVVIVIISVVVTIIFVQCFFLDIMSGSSSSSHHQK